MQVTISLLPVSLSLVHIPRSRLAHLSSPIIRQILQPNPTFLNLTCNEIELSIFAETHTLDEFESIARRDRQKQRSRSGSGSSRKTFSDSQVVEPVQISYEKWSVLQIDSHSNALDDAGARVYELSAPLAAAGISILYQSSYLSDFIFVKETRLQEVMSLFSAAGFDLYSDNSISNSLLSPPPSPLVDLNQGHDAISGAVLTRTRASTDSLSALTSSDSGSQTPSRTKSHSPTSGDVQILSPDLTCVGLSDEHVDHWSLKIIKLIAFPDLIPSPKNVSSHITTHSKPLSLYNPLFDALASSSLRRYPRARSSSGDSSLKYGSSSSFSDDGDDDEEGYFSHSPTGLSANLSTSSLVTSANSSLSTAESVKSSSPTATLSPSTQQPFASPSSHRPPSKHLMGPLSPLSPITNTPIVSNGVHFDGLAPATSEPRSSSISSGSHSVSGRSTNRKFSSRVPFFNITRTTEGTSFTTDVDLLARLFPPHERYMVVCGVELDAADEKIARQEEGPLFENPSDNNELNLGLDAEIMSDTDREEIGESGLLKCLQIDLRKFGLDKYGLVNRFSRVLEENGINHMHSSTYKTANLLVGKRHAARACTLLRAC
ncbi:hypothetical protein J3R30DRAFT_2738701 [Lentinula aciculospora]|uniref:CASTOR ACT domain-containing protein n=1 Tax=Lentinula aciculospora TaxID=153920 RepID=A0A9W9DNL3_9AGAR|nr:hypothetical protein J3R30DRAFT_2738701 [Lentinula aciculospora]